MDGRGYWVRRQQHSLQIAYRMGHRGLVWFGMAWVSWLGVLERISLYYIALYDIMVGVFLLLALEYRLEVLDSVALEMGQQGKPVCSQPSFTFLKGPPAKQHSKRNATYVLP